MADNTTLDTGSGGDTIRTEDRTTYKTPVSLLDVGGTASEALIGDAGVYLPVEGAAAENAAVAGNPLLIGGRYDASPRTLGDGDVGAPALDADGALHISDGGNTITVDGTVDLGATDNAVLDSIDAAVNGTLTVGSHAVTNAGTFAVQVDGDALTALQLIDDAIYADDADWTDSTSKHMLTGGVYQSAPQTITDGDVGPFQVTSNGYLITSVNGTVTVDGSGVTQPVSATQLDIDSLTKDDDEVLVWANTAKDGTGTDYVPLVDADGHLQIDVLSGGGGGTQYAVDAALGLTPTGTLAVAQRDDALSALTPVEGDAIALRVDANGALWVIPSGTVTVDGSGVTQPISAATLPLPSGAATEATLSSVASEATLSSLNSTVATETTLGSVKTAVELIDDAVYTDGTGTPSKAVAVAGTDGTNPQIISVDTSGHVQVDALSVPAPLNVTGGGAESTALRVTLANDSTGVISVDDNSGSLTVDATQLDIDDLAATTDAVSAALDTSQIMNGLTSLTPKYAKIDAATSGNNTLVAAVAGKKIRVLALFMVAAGVVTVRLEDGASGTALTGQQNLTSNSGFTLNFCPVGWFETTANTLLNLELDAAVSVDGCLVYVEV